MSARAPRVLMIYLEPAPYITKLIAELRRDDRFDVDALFVAPALSQAWGGPAEAENFLPQGSWAALRAIARKIRSGNYALVHLAGWGHPVLAGALLLSRAHGLPATVETVSAPVGASVMRRITWLPWSAISA